jgi:hypothetical protein
MIKTLLSETTPQGGRVLALLSLDGEDQTFGGREGVEIDLWRDEDGQLSEAVCSLNELNLLPFRR